MNRDSTINPLVSVCCVTYNHMRYIVQAIESFLNQKTNFPFEVIIHDDASSDGTSDVIREYADKRPDLIKPIFQTENQYSRSRAISARFVWPKCRGKYIALCEGDDYWTDPLKLQKQVDFLERNDAYSMCFHEADVLDNGVKTRNNDFRRDRTFTIQDMARRNIGRIVTASCVFRNRTNTFPVWYAQLRSLDWGLHMINAEYGKVYFMDEVMAVYRIHEGGVWSHRSDSEKTSRILESMRDLDRAFNYRYHADFKKGMRRIKFRGLLKYLLRIPGFDRLLPIYREMRYFRSLLPW